MKRLFWAVLAVLAALLAVIEARRDVPPPGRADACLSCHDGATDPDPSHPVAVLGCASCHLGNAFALSKDRAHQGMVARPGALATAGATCGRVGCHPDIVSRAQGSIMATNAGILNVLARHWEPDGPGRAPFDAPGLAARPDRPGLYAEQFAKMCGACHAWRGRDPEAGEVGLRGGCAGCHVVAPGRSEDIRLKTFTHSRLSTRIPSDNCVRCHNRSARVGLSMFGLYESENAGAPLMGGLPGPPRLSGGRRVMELPGDVHHEKGRMDCVDCHTHLEIMGDGASHEFAEGQRDVACRTCHAPVFAPVAAGGPGASGGSGAPGEKIAPAAASAPPVPVGAPDRTSTDLSRPDADRPGRVATSSPTLPPASARATALRQAALNGGLPPLEGAAAAVSPRGALLYHVRDERGPAAEAARHDPRTPVAAASSAPSGPAESNVVLYRKRDGARLPVTVITPEKAHHALPGHERLSCQACHSPVMPQCAGCHLVYRRDGLQHDWLAGRRTPGEWFEGRSLMRFETPILGIGPGGRVTPFAPAQVGLSVFDQAGRHDPSLDLAITAMATFDPHATQKASRTCRDCHLGPKALGLGTGRLWAADGRLAFQGTYDPVASGFPVPVGPDSFVAPDGAALHTTSRPGLRPFEAGELARVLSVGPCLACHQSYEDPPWRDFRANLQRFEAGQTACPAAGRESARPDGPSRAGREDRALAGR